MARLSQIDRRQKKDARASNLFLANLAENREVRDGRLTASVLHSSVRESNRGIGVLA